MSGSKDIATLVNQYIASVASTGELAKQVAQEIADKLADGSLTLLQLIQALGPTLTSDDPTTRSFSVQCLSSTLEQLVNKVHLTNQDVNVLLQFLVKKLEDEKLTLHTLAALTSLVQFKKFLPRVNDSFTLLISAITKVYEPRKHLAKVRYEAFNLLRTLLEFHHETIFSSSDFLEAFAQAFIHVASGEKDPRNLLQSFKLNESINEKFQFEDRNTNSTHDRLLTDLFDVCFCYFPISFSPPANDPYKITAADLKKELRKTIASQSQFSQDTFPSLFEKLTSTNPSVRNDVLQTLLLCAQNYDMSTIQQYWVSLWDALKFEILHNDLLIFQPQASYIVSPGYEQIEDTDDNKTLILTLLTLMAVVEKLSPSDELIRSLIDTVIGDLKSNFESEDNKTVKGSVLLMCSLLSVSSMVFDKFIEFFFSFEVWGKYVRSDYQEEKEDEDMEVDVSLTVARQRDLIDNLGFVFTSSLVLGRPGKLNNYKDHLLLFLGQLLQTSSKLDKTLKCKIIQQLIKLISMKDFFLRSDVLLVLDWFNGNLLDVLSSRSAGWEKDMLLTEILNGIVCIMSEGLESQINENVNCVVEVILPTLLDSLQDVNVLYVLQKVCVNYQILEVLSIRLLNKIDLDNCGQELLRGILDCLTTSFNQAQLVKPFMTNTWYKNFVPRFLNVIVGKAAEDAVVLELSGKLLGLIVRYTEFSKHQQILEDMVKQFSGESEIAGRLIDIFEKPEAEVALFKHMLAKIDKRCAFPVNIHEKIDKCSKLVCQISNEFVRVQYLQLIAILINKFTPQNDLGNSQIMADLFEASRTNIDALEVATWLLKGLITRLDRVGIEFLSKFLNEVLDSEDLQHSNRVSRCFNVLMADLDVFQNLENSKVKIVSGVMNLNVKLLYKQQIFEDILEKILARFQGVDSEARKGVLLATLAIIIDSISPKILKPHLKEILPLVLNGLGFENPTILKASLETFKVIILENPDLISENIDSLMVKLVDLSTTKIIANKKVVNDAQIRFAALECLEGIFANLEAPQIVKYQASTRDRLRVCLDDKKRSVRKKACDVRQILYELGR